MKLLLMCNYESMKNYHNQYFYLIITIFFVVSAGCSRDKDDDPVPVTSAATFNVKLQFEVDNVPLEFNQLLYQTESGSNYSVDRLQFYLSDFVFKRTDGVEVKSDEIIFVDAKNSKNITFKLSQIPQGNYQSVKFLIGLDSAHNISNSLPNIIDNVNMAWPDLMGGGYHFLKFEGNFNDGGTNAGFAMHLGNNQHVVPVGVTKEMNITSNEDTLKLTMNLNEWFRNPHVYDFNVDGNYSMGNMSAMMKLAANGRDVFDE